MIVFVYTRIIRKQVIERIMMQWADDALGQLEYGSDMYTHYRRLISEKPVGEIMIEYLDGIQVKKT